MLKSGSLENISDLTLTQQALFFEQLNCSWPFKGSKTGGGRTYTINVAKDLEILLKANLTVVGVPGDWTISASVSSLISFEGIKIRIMANSHIETFVLSYQVNPSPLYLESGAALYGAVALYTSTERPSCSAELLIQLPTL